MSAILDRSIDAKPLDSGCSEPPSLLVRRPLGRLRSCAGACAWIVLAALAAAAMLAVFVLVTEAGGGSLVDTLIRPINLLRLAVMTVCLALWGYILRAGREPEFEPDV